jgi:hypothetical protein
MTALLAAVLALSTLAAQAPASQATAAKEPPPAGEVEGVVVTAPRPEVIRSFVEQLSVEATGVDQLGRWDRKICPGVTGAKPKYAQLINDRIAMAAYSVGLDVGEPGCRANILIVLTDDGNKVARELVTNYPRVMDKHGEAHTRGRRALKEFVETPRPVRWWHVSQTVTADGMPVQRGGEVAVRGGGRVSRNVRQDFHHQIIIVDVARGGPKPLAALADYVAMVALAQIDPKARTERFETILNLFANADAPTALTEWDRRYLKGLYEASREARNVRVQEKAIARELRGRN